MFESGLRKRMGFVFVCALVLALIVGFGKEAASQTGPWPAPGWKPPVYLLVRCSSAGGTGYAVTNAIITAIENSTGVKWAAPPTDDTLAQFAPIKKGQAMGTTIMADEVQLAIQGAMMFKDAGWPPQSLRMIWFGAPQPQGWLAKGVSGVKSLNDMVGKRVARTPAGSQDDFAYFGLFAYTKAHPDFVDLSWDNLKGVPVAEYDQGMDAVMTGAADVGVFSGLTATTLEAAAAPGGVNWIPLPNKTANDKKAWAAFQEVVPCYGPSHWEGTIANASKEKPVDIWEAIYHWITYDFLDENVAYWTTMQIHMNYDKFKDKHAMAKYWNIDFALSDNSVQGWFVPWHPGSVRYFKDIGRWTPAMQARQEQNLRKFPQTNTKTP